MLVHVESDIAQMYTAPFIPTAQKLLEPSGNYQKWNFLNCFGIKKGFSKSEPGVSCQPNK